MLNKMLTVVATSNGGYSGKCLKLSITNASPDAMTVYIDPAMIFIPDDTTYQNLVTLGNETIVLAPSETKNINLDSYCGKSYAHIPRAKLNYKFARQGDSQMIKTLSYVKENNVASSLAQCAVWMYTNGHCLSSVYRHDQTSASEKFVKYIADLRKMKMPVTFTELQFNNNLDQPVLLMNGETKVFVPLKWQSTDARNMYVTVLKENGDVYKRIYGNEEIDQYGHTVWVEFNSVNDTKGTYYVELKDDNKIWDRKRVVVGYDPCQMM